MTSKEHPVQVFSTQQRDETAPHKETYSMKGLEDARELLADVFRKHIWPPAAEVRNAFRAYESELLHTYIMPTVRSFAFHELVRAKDTAALVKVVTAHVLKKLGSEGYMHKTEQSPENVTVQEERLMAKLCAQITERKEALNIKDKELTSAKNELNACRDNASQLESALADVSEKLAALRETVKSVYVLVRKEHDAIEKEELS
jgi:hypothetical protein